MTKTEIIALTQRIAAKLARGENSARPISESRKRRIEELRRQMQAEDESAPDARLRA